MPPGWKRTGREPDFLLPETFMEVGTDQQFEFLRDWQRKVYEAGYLGMAWPKEYGGGGQPQVMQDIVNAEMARLKVPFVPNTIGLNWAGPADPGDRHRSGEAEVHSRHPVRGRHLVSGLLGAGQRFGSGGGNHPRGS